MAQWAVAARSAVVMAVEARVGAATAVEERVAVLVEDLVEGMVVEVGVAGKAVAGKVEVREAVTAAEATEEAKAVVAMAAAMAEAVMVAAIVVGETVVVKVEEAAREVREATAKEAYCSNRSGESPDSSSLDCWVHRNLLCTSPPGR